ncbi:MAG: hypothetical protein MO852_07115 [Candidatus Devosia euplotis]|nr:hypothetical protein [Candidatus Devosia euplotis]
MIKNTLIAIVTAATLLGAAAPAFADTSASGDSYDIIDDNADGIVASLQAQGINASSVEDWAIWFALMSRRQMAARPCSILTPARCTPSHANWPITAPPALSDGARIATRTG